MFTSQKIEDESFPAGGPPFPAQASEFLSIGRIPWNFTKYETLTAAYVKQNHIQIVILQSYSDFELKT